jgi:hypothetical protein
MQPFKISDEAKALKAMYPAPEEFRDAAKALTEPEKFGVVRLWISEGIPFCFRECPMLYEAIRSWLARELGVHAKEITLIGSARVGYSLAPTSDYGRPFDSSSDLDFSIISASLFDRCVSCFNLWLSDYESKKIAPQNQNESFYWKHNYELVPINISRGFIDPYKIPLRRTYQIACDIGDSLWKLHQKLKETENAPSVRRPSVRVYRDWRSAVRQFKINFCRIAG